MVLRSRPWGPLRVGPPQAVFDLPERERRWGDCLVEFVILSLKHANLLIQAKFLYCRFQPRCWLRSRGAEVFSQFSLCQLVTLGLSSLLSASPRLISRLDGVKSLDNNKSMGCLGGSAGSAVGLRFVYDWLHLLLYFQVSKLLILVTLAPLAHRSEPVWSQQDHMNAAEKSGSSSHLRRFRLDQEGERRRRRRGEATHNKMLDPSNQQLAQHIVRRIVPTWNWEVKKPFCAAWKPAASFSSVGCQRGRKNPLCLRNDS